MGGERRVGERERLGVQKGAGGREKGGGVREVAEREGGHKGGEKGGKGRFGERER